jgi:hypothetical protein
MDELEKVPLLPEQGKRGGHRPVEEPRALAPAGHEDGEGRPRGLGRHPGEFLADGIPQPDPLAPERGEGGLEGGHGLPRPADEETVRVSGPDVLFEDERGDAEPGREEHDRAGAVAPDADDQPGPEPDEKGERPQERERQEGQPSQALEPAAFEPLDPQGDEIDALRVHDAHLDGPATADEREPQVRVERAEAAADGQGRVEVPARSPAADDDAPFLHDLIPTSPFRREMLRRMPTAARLQTSDDRP